MSIYFDYLTDYERSVMVEATEIENEFDKLQTLYEMTCLQFSQMEKEIEHKVFSESGTYDDFTYLIQEAGNEVVEKKKSILTKIIEAIKRLFAKITGKTNDIRSSQLPPDTMINVPADVEEKSSIITNAMNKMKVGIAKLQTGDFTGAKDIISVAAAPVALVTITGGVAMKQIEKRRGDKIVDDMDEAKGFFNGLWDKITSKVNGIVAPKDADTLNESLNPVQKVLSGINSVIDAINLGVKNNSNNKSEHDAAREAESRQNAHNNILEKPDNKGGKYQIDRTTGVIKHIGPDGKELPVDMKTVPRDIIKAAQHLKGKAAQASQEAKQQSAKRDQIASKLTPSRTFTPEETGVKVYVDGTSARITINGKTVVEPLPYGTSESEAKRVFKRYGVSKGYKNIYYALRAAQEGIQSAKRESIKIDKNEEKIARQNRTVAESVCELMNDVLSNTVFEAVITDDCISLMEYAIEPQVMSDDMIQYLENAGYTVQMTDTTYEIYE